MGRLRLATLTDIGSRRRNEDCLRHASGPAGQCVVVADGAGGHADGDQASRVAAESVANALISDSVSFDPATLADALLVAHRELQQQHAAGHAAASARMHTTIVALWIDLTERLAIWSHVGDSRLYRFRLGKGELLTEDDSVVAHLLRLGLLGEAEVESYPYKGQLMAALGTEKEIHPHTVPRAVALMAGDVYLLCTDGWWEHFGCDDFEYRLLRAASPAEWLEDMAQYIRERHRPNQDNFSAIAVWTGDPAEALDQGGEETVAPPI